MAIKVESPKLMMHSGDPCHKVEDVKWSAGKSCRLQKTYCCEHMFSISEHKQDVHIHAVSVDQQLIHKLKTSESGFVSKGCLATSGQ